jgi:hypothetical protein
MFVSGPYNYVPMGVDETVEVKSTQFGGFLCENGGDITITMPGTPDVVVLNAFPVTAGEFYPFPMKIALNGATVELDNGASGLLLA